DPGPISRPARTARWRAMGPETRSGCRRTSGQAHSHHRAQREVAELLAALDVGGLGHYPGAAQSETYVALGDDPEHLAAGAVVAVGFGAGERAEQMVEHARAANLETDPLVGRRHLPAGVLGHALVELVGHVAGVVAPREREHRRRQDAHAVELAAAAEHLGEA